jgi:hypothetical protein
MNLPSPSQVLLTMTFVSTAAVATYGQDYLQLQ